MTTISNLARSVRIDARAASDEASRGGGELGTTAQRLLGQTTELDRLRQAPGTFERMTGRTAADTAARSAPSPQALIDDLQASVENDPEGLRRALTQAFGDKADAATLDRLASRIMTNGLPMPAAIAFVEPGTLGDANRGAYDAADGGTLLLDRRLLEEPQRLHAVFAEEMGHHLDATLGGEDAAGDEGEIFARSLLDGGLDAGTLTRLQGQLDHGFIIRHGLRTQVEFHGASAGSTSTSPTPNPHAPSPSSSRPSPSPSTSPTLNPHPPSIPPLDSSPTPNPHPPSVPPLDNSPTPNPHPPSVPPLDNAPDPELDGDRPPADAGGGRWWSNVGHFVLDVLGLVPVLGEWADGLNASWYAAEGRYWEASLSAAGTVPIAGIGITIGKWFGALTRTAARAEDLAAAAELSNDTLRTIERLREAGFHDIADAAGRSIGRVSQMGVETRARMSDLLADPSISLTPNARIRVQRAMNALEQHLSDADLSGALQERMGIPIGSMNHVKEVGDSLRSLRKAREDLIRAIEHLRATNPTDNRSASRLSGTIEAMNVTVGTTEALLE